MTRNDVNDDSCAYSHESKRKPRQTAQIETTQAPLGTANASKWSVKSIVEALMKALPLIAIKRGIIKRIRWSMPSALFADWNVHGRQRPMQMGNFSDSFRHAVRIAMIFAFNKAALKTRARDIEDRRVSAGESPRATLLFGTMRERIGLFLMCVSWQCVPTQKCWQSRLHAR